MGFQWMVCWWLLVFTQFYEALNFEPASFSKQEKLGHEYIMAPRQCSKLAYQATKKMHEFAHGKCFVFL
jgi:hypothetical protein